MNVLIAIVAYNRPKCLQRILDTLTKAVYPEKTDLAISIDYSGEFYCENIAKTFDWKFGEKKIISHTSKLGLRDHILSVGDLVQDYDALILLEDDIVVSPDYYIYFNTAIHFVSVDEKIAGISLYNFEKNLINWREFTPIGDGYDNYYMQVPCSWGQGWTKKQWFNFKDWYSLNKKIDLANSKLPKPVKSWPESSWLKYFYQYLIAKNKFFFYPKTSFATNMGDEGTHHKGKTGFITTNLAYSYKSYRFCGLYESSNVFDFYFEIILSDKDKQKLNLNEDLTIDLYGEKPLSEIDTIYLISKKTCKNPIATFPFTIFPLHLNLFIKIIGENIIQFNYGKTASFIDSAGKADLPLRLSPGESRYLIQKGKREIQDSRAYKLGYSILHPFFSLKRIFQKVIGCTFL